MRINEKTEVIGGKVMLVPYDEHLVLRYHEWMKSPELLENTASTPLTLEEEYEMQKSWRVDNDKLTFIVIDKQKAGNNHSEAMIGDANLFINENCSAEVMIMIAETSYRRNGYGHEALMLILRYGNKCLQEMNKAISANKKIAPKMSDVFLGVENLGIQKYEAKIGKDNTPSISLFQKIGFEKTNESDVFNEITFSKRVTDSWRDELNLISYVTNEKN